MFTQSQSIYYAFLQKLLQVTNRVGYNTLMFSGLAQAQSILEVPDSSL